MLLVLFVQLLNHGRLPVTPWTVAHQAFLFITNSWSLLKLMPIELVIPFSRLNPLLPPSSPALNLSQHQSLFQWAGYSHQVAKILGVSASASVLPILISLGLTGLIFLQSKGLSRVFSSVTIQKNQFYGAQPSLWSNSHIHTCWKNHRFEYMDFVGKVMSFFLICWLGLW